MNKQQLFDREDFSKYVLDNLHEGLYFTDVSRKITYWNKTAEELTGYTAKEVLGHRCSDNILMHVDEQGNNLCQDGCLMSLMMADGQSHQANVFMHHKRGHRVPVSVRVAPLRNTKGEIIGAADIFTENSSSLSLQEENAALRRQAMIDPLTEIGNRRYAENRLNSIINESGRYEWPFGLLLIDIDFFKDVNDQRGHDVGDDVLRMVAKTIEMGIRNFDVVARWGGEEFIAIIKQVDKEGLRTVAEKLRMLVEHSAILKGKEKIAVTISIGGTAAKKKDELHKLIKRADIELYRAKASGRNRVCVN
ncbi:MAG TPA: GGDEF domain-containing protein [bacterium]|nr:GGDEF domain-containing protein [bacterium]